MNVRTNDIELFLLAVDDAVEKESPVLSDGDTHSDANWKKIEVVRKELSAKCGYNLELDNQVQDATFCADVFLLNDEQSKRRAKTGAFAHFCDFRVRFSNFGELAVIMENNIKIDGVDEILALNGFKLVSIEDLEKPYSGLNPFFKDRTWWDRYFDYW